MVICNNNTYISFHFLSIFEGNLKGFNHREVITVWETTLKNPAENYMNDGAVEQTWLAHFTVEEILTHQTGLPQRLVKPGLLNSPQPPFITFINHHHFHTCPPSLCQDFWSDQVGWAADWIFAKRHIPNKKLLTSPMTSWKKKIHFLWSMSSCIVIENSWWLVNLNKN